MKIVVLGSSSTGNSTYIEFGNKKFLIDVGLGYNDIKNKLISIGTKIEDIDFILITHAHNDHVRSLHSFSRVYNTKIYISKYTFLEYIKKDLIRNYEFFDDLDNLEGIKFIKIPISHDKKGFGFIFEVDKKSIFYMTDTGFIHSKYYELLKNRTVYLIESNHDVEMEMKGSKDYYTKIRNTGDEGHLSNDQCSMYLNHFIGNDTKVIMLMHISEHDNTYELAYNTNRNSIDNRIKVLISNKDNISDIIEL